MNDTVLRYRCAACRRVFYTTVAAELWGFTLMPKSRKKRQMFCSYKCMRTVEKPMLDKMAAEMDLQFKVAEEEEKLEKLEKEEEKLEKEEWEEQKKELSCASSSKRAQL